MINKGDSHQPIAIIAHGGAWEIPADQQADAVDGCSRAAGVGWDILEQGGSALDAVEATVRTLEDDPTFDAGLGSVLNALGEIELDAMIMDGSTLNLGAAVAVKRVRHPVTLARLIMTASDHAILACQGAEQFARDHGIPCCPTWRLAVAREIDRWHQSTSTNRASLDLPGIERPSQHPGDTVGAVALDSRGHLAAATSTGGTANKYPGRVGDSPLVGCGAYADDSTGAVSATGDGEHLMRIVISKTASDYLGSGLTAQEAADASISLLAERTPGHGGLVVLGRAGDIGISHNTGYLAHAYVVEGRTTRGIKR